MKPLSYVRNRLPAHAARRSRRAKVQPIGTRRSWCQWLEQLEDRTLLSVTATVSGSDVKFYSPLITDNVYLRTASSQVEWSSDGTTWSSTDSGGNALPTIAPAVSNTFTFQMSGGVYITSSGFTGAGGNLTFEGVGNPSGGFIGPGDVHIQGNVITQGGNLTINDVQGVDVGSGLFVSTRDISPTDLVNSNFTGESVGNSGTLSIKVNNTDILNPILYINFTSPHIEVGASASVLADATSNFTAGDVTLDVVNINYSLTDQLFTLFSAMQRSADLTLDASATVEGSNVTLDAHAGDFNPLDLLLPSGPSSVGQNLTPQQQQSSNSLGATSDSVIGLLNPLTLPLSVIYRNSSALVTVNQSAVIAAAGTVNLGSDAEADAGATASYQFNTRVQLSLAFSYAQTDAETVIDGGAKITAAGDVSVTALASSQAVSNAQSATQQNSPNTIQLSGAIGITNVTAHATEANTASITSGGNVQIEADGFNDNEDKTAVQSNTNGTAGVSFSVGDTTTSILAEADGTVTASGAVVGTLQPINPFTQIDWGKTNSIMTFSAATNFSTGAKIAYSSGSGGAIPGLVSGSDYYVIDVPNQTDEIQLASSKKNAQHGIPIVFGSFPYLTAEIGGDLVNVPIIQVDAASNALEFSYNPGFSSGQTVTYRAVPNQGVTGLVDGDPYSIQPVTGKAGEFQLDGPNSTLETISPPPTFGALPYITLMLNGASVNLPITQVDDNNNAIGYTDPIPGLVAENVVYHAAAGQAIANLVNGQTYSLEPDTANGLTNEFQFFQGTALVPIYTDPTFTGLEQNLPATLKSNTSTLAFNFNTGFTTSSLIIYNGATDSNSNPVTITGLTPGQVYSVLPVTTDTTGETFQLSSTIGGTALTISASGTIAKFQFTPYVGINADTNTINVGFNIALVPGMKTSGIPLTYQGALGSTYSGLFDGQTYYGLLDADPYNPQVIYLTNSSADSQLAYTSGQTSYDTMLASEVTTFEGMGQDQTTATASATALAQTEGYVWSAQGIDSASDAPPPPAGPNYPVSAIYAAGISELSFSFATGMTLGSPIDYEGTTSGTITGLTPDTTYYAIPDAINPDAFALAMTSQDAALGHAISLSGTGTITVTLSPPPPAPSAATVSASAFNFTSDQDWRTGDAIVWGGATDANGNNVTINTTDPNNGNASGTLILGTTYYAIVADPTNNPGVIELATTMAEAEAQNPQPLTLTPSGGTVANVVLEAPPAAGASPFPIDLPSVVVVFGSLDIAVMTGISHTLTPVHERVNIVANLDSTDKADAASQPGKNWKTTAQTLSKYGSVLSSKLGSFFTAVGNKSPFNGNQSPKSQVQATPGGTGADPHFSLAGSFVVMVSQDEVNAVVGSTANITSTSGVTVNALMTDKVQDLSEGTVTVNPTSPTSTAAALAVTVAVFSPTVKAKVMSDAIINSGGTLSVTANLIYPVLFLPLPSAVTNIATTSGSDLKTLLTSHSLGVQQLLFNDWTNAASNTGPPPKGATGSLGGAELGIGGAIDVHYWNNDVEATIESNASINQTSADDTPDQAVEVEADTTWDNIGVAGIFSLKVSPSDLYKAYKGGNGSNAGAQGTKDGIGASININAMSNTTLAQIQSGARIHVGNIAQPPVSDEPAGSPIGPPAPPSGSLTVIADQNILDITLNQSGSQAGDVGFTGTVVWNNVSSSTIAQIQDGVFINKGDAQGGPVVVNATDTVYLGGLAGGAATSQHLGFGFTLAVNNFSRTTLALVGSNPLTNNGAAPLAGFFNVASLDALATTTGVIALITYAAASSSPPQSSFSPRDAFSGVLPGTDSGDSNSPGMTGVGAAGAVSVNVLEAQTEAVIDDSGTFDLGRNVTIKAVANTILVSIAGAFGQAEQTMGDNVGVAGAFAVNVLESTTKAFIYGATINNAVTLTVSAIHDDTIATLSAGAAGARPGDDMSSNAYAGSVSVNLILPDTEAYLANANVTLTGAASVTAQEESDIYAAAGTDANGGTGGFGAALAFNMIGSPLIGGTVANPELVPNQPSNLPVARGLTAAYLSDSTVSMSGNNTLTVSATRQHSPGNTIYGNTDILSIAGSIGYASGGSSSGGTGFAEMVAANLIANDTEAYINSSSVVKGAASPTVHADDDSAIDSFGGAVGAASGTGIGAALAYNGIDSSITADVENSTVNVTGTLSVTAVANQNILGVDLGVGVGTTPKQGDSDAGAGSLAINMIEVAADAHVSKSSEITAGGGLNVTSMDTATIEIGAGAVAIATSKGSASVGASIVIDTVKNITRAYIDDSTVLPTTGNVQVEATSTLGITAVAAGGSGSGQYSVGVALVYNEITDQTDAQITGGSSVASAGLTVSAMDTSNIGTGAGLVDIALGKGNSGGSLGAAIALNTISNSVMAYIDDSTVNSSAAVSVTATSSETIFAIALGVAGAASNGKFSAGLVGSGAGNTIGDTTLALIEDGSSVTTTGGAAVTVMATESVQDHRRGRRACDQLQLQGEPVGRGRCLGGHQRHRHVEHSRPGRGGHRGFHRRCRRRPHRDCHDFPRHPGRHHCRVRIGL